MLKTILKGFQTFHEKHEKLKKTVHTAWRYPLPKWGQYGMGAFYASVPIVGGWFWMQWAISKSHESIGPKGEKLLTENNNNNEENKNLISNGGDTIIRDGESIQIGAGGYLGGVRLAKSSEQDQIQSKENLERFFQKLQKQQKRNKKKKQNDKVEEEQAEEE